MVKFLRGLLLSSLLLSQTLQAAPLPNPFVPPHGPNIDLTGVSLSDLLRLYFAVDKRPYTICSAAVADLRRVTVRAEPARSEQALRRILRLEGYDLRVTKGFVEVCSLEAFNERMRASIDALPGQSGPGAPIPPSYVPTGSPLSPVASPGPVADPVPTTPTPLPVKSVLRTYSFRFQAASAILPAVVAIGVGSWSVPSSKRVQTDGSGSSPTTGAGENDGGVIVWRGPEDDWPDVRELLVALDRPPAQADLVVAALSVANAATDRDAISLVGTALGIRLNVGSASMASTDLGAMTVALDSLRGRRDVKILQVWSGQVESGGHIEAQTGGQVPVTTAITESEGGRARQSIEYRATGTSLKINPVVLADLVRVQLSFEDSSVVSASALTPAFETRKLDAAMQVCFGCVSVVSKLESSSEDRSQQRVFFGLLPVEKTSARASGRVIYVVAAGPKTFDLPSDVDGKSEEAGVARSGSEDAPASSRSSAKSS